MILKCIIIEIIRSESNVWCNFPPADTIFFSKRDE